MSTQKDQETRLSWKVDSLCLIYSRSKKTWYDGTIEKVIPNDNDDEKQPKLANEWLIVRYNGKKTKKIQRNCDDIKPIPTVRRTDSLKKGSLCLIYSNIINLWCKGEVLSIFKDDEGEWLKVKYWDTNHHKICDIQRYSAQLKPYNDKLLYKPNAPKIPPPPKPWKVLKTNNDILPIKLSNIVRLNDNEFIVAPYGDIEHDINENDGIYKYNTNKNEWELFISYPDEFIAEYINIAVDYDNEIIYLFNGFAGHGIWKLDIQTQTFECFPFENNCGGALTYVIKSECNIFLGLNHNKHLLMNDNNDFDVIHEFKELPKGMLSFGMVYNWMEKYVLLMGGFKGFGLGRSDEIWKYFVIDKKWEKMKVKMPHKMQSFGCVITLGCEYVLVFGGRDSNGLSDKIYSLDLFTMEWRKAKIVCPFKGVGFGNVILAMENDIEYVHVLQGQHQHIMAPLSDVLSY